MTGFVTFLRWLFCQILKLVSNFPIHFFFHNVNFIFSITYARSWSIYIYIQREREGERERERDRERQRETEREKEFQHFASPFM